MNEKDSHTGPIYVRHPLGITQKAPSPSFFSEFSYVTYIYFSTCLFTPRKHLNTESKHLITKLKGLRAFLFCSHTLCSALTKHFLFLQCLIDVYKMAMVSAIKPKRPSGGYLWIKKVTTTSKANLKSEMYSVTYRILSPTRG